MNPEPSTGPGQRAGGPVSASGTRNHKTCCPKCDNSVSGLASGRPARFCVEHPVLDLHQEYYSLIAPRMMLNCELAFHFCEGLYRIPRGELTVPQVHKPRPTTATRQNLTNRVCKQCGMSYRPRSLNSSYCSDTCSRKARSIREQKRRAEKRTGDPK